MAQQDNKMRRLTGGVSAIVASLCLLVAAQTASAQQPATPNPAVDQPSTTFPAYSPFAIATQDEVGIDDPQVTPLRLQLNQPFSLEQFGQAVLGQTGAARGVNSGMNYRLADGLSLSSGISLAESNEFQSLGSIHCENGVLDAVSYRASNCYFIDGTDRTTAGAIALGANFQAGDNARASVNLFREQRSSTSSVLGATSIAGSSSLSDPLGLGLAPGDRLLNGLDPIIAGPGFSSSERTGVDVEFQVGFSTDQAGDLVLGLQLTRVLDSGMEGVFYASPGANNWTIAKPYDSARLSLDWNRGAFSGGLDSYYRSAVRFIDRNELESQATFDVHFSWRAPWNASVSVGASNLLGASVNESAAPDTNMVDPLESIYGRIPYVRYKQDL